MQTRQTLRLDAGQAKLVVYGTLANARLNANDPAGGGVTDLQLNSVLKSDPILGNKKVIELPRFVPLNATTPATWLVFCDVYQGRLDPYRGLPVSSPAVVDYLRGALALDAKDRTQSLLYFFSYLGHREPEIAEDAYLEFARATDQEIGQVEPKLAPDKLRRLLQDPQTPGTQLGLFAFLLGVCGNDQDALLLQRLIAGQEAAPKVLPQGCLVPARSGSALDGLLSGYIQQRPREGWELAWRYLGDAQRPFLQRLAVLGTLRFYQSWKPQEHRGHVVRGLGLLLPQGDMADLAVEDLRRWQYWELTNDVLALYGRRTHDAPIMRRAILRYALSCPRNEASQFVAQRRQQEPDLVREIEESLQFEKPR